MVKFHFSVDDVLDSLVEPAGSWFFAFLDGLNADFEINVNLYLFLEGERASLGEATPQASKWLRENAWIRLGPHALNAGTPPHAQSVREQRDTIDRIYRRIDALAGPDRYSSWVRLHYFSECHELAPEWQARGVEALLTTDKPAVSYRLAGAEKETLRRNGRVSLPGIDFVRSNLRIENLDPREDALDRLNGTLPPEPTEPACAVIFTHEYELRRPEVRAAARQLLGALRATGAEST